MWFSQTPTRFLELCFLVNLASFWEHVGSIFEVPGTLGQHSGPSGCQGQFLSLSWSTFLTTLAPFGLQVGRQSSRRRPKGPQTGPFGASFRPHFVDKMRAMRASAYLTFFLRFSTSFWTAQPTFGCSRRSPNEVSPFRRLLQKTLRKASILIPFRRPFS